ncbi:hypothetical protein [Mycolicibacterium sp. XJ870]
MLKSRVQQLLNYRLTIAELIAIGVLLSLPYLIIGGIWSATHTDHLHGMNGPDLAVSFLGSIASWPVLLFADVCMA